MAEYKFKNSTPLKGGNYWQNYVSGVDLRQAVGMEDYFKPKGITGKGVLKSLYGALGFNPSFKEGKVDIGMMKKGRFDVPLSKEGHSIYGSYKRKRGSGSKLSDYDWNVGVKFPIGK